MKRTYELVFIADPRLSDEEAVEIADEYKNMITANGSAEVTREESWGKRKLAYPIGKFNEGRYHVYYISADPKNPLPEVEQRLRQNDKILRHLVVRTDLDVKRAETKGKKRKPKRETSEASTAD
ncbi:MAG TPA: 30S ribosomal protein S6 [Thermoanaerobaculia bacterium]|nr:30S ribosomal protein S6 [Thermoanaerobaculia bacterium]